MVHCFYLLDEIIRVCIVDLGPAKNSTCSSSRSVANTLTTPQDEEQNANYGQELLSKTVPSKAPTKSSFKGKQKRYPLPEFLGNQEQKKRRERIRPAVSDQDNEESSPSFKARRPSNRRHQCFRCDQTFNLRSKFNDHLHTHHAGQFSECKHNGWCTKVFPTDEKKMNTSSKITIQ